MGLVNHLSYTATVHAKQKLLIADDQLPDFNLVTLWHFSLNLTTDVMRKHNAADRIKN